MHSDIKKFAKLLGELCNIFELPLPTVHIFYEIGKSRAFNRNNSLFFNLYFYEKLHAAAKEKTAMINWFFTFCHELAHYFEPLHNATHEVSEPGNSKGGNISSNVKYLKLNFSMHGFLIGLSHYCSFITHSLLRLIYKNYLRNCKIIKSF